MPTSFSEHAGSSPICRNLGDAGHLSLLEITGSMPEQLHGLIDSGLAAVGRIDVMVNNAGLLAIARFDKGRRRFIEVKLGAGCSILNW